MAPGFRWTTAPASVPIKSKKTCNDCKYSEEGQETEKPAPVVPKTGDDTPIGLYALCGLATLAGAVLLTKKRKAKA